MRAITASLIPHVRKTFPRSHVSSTHICDKILRNTKSQCFTTSKYKKYGHESEEIMAYAAHGDFKSVDPEAVQTCGVYHEMLISHPVATSGNTLWVQSWVESSVLDRDIQYEDDILFHNGKVPYSSCGPFCCHDYTDLRHVADAVIDDDM